jgi:hypothetical protein
MSTIDLLALLGMVCTPLTLVFGVAWYTTKRELQLHRELERDRLRGIADRFAGPEPARLEQAVDAIALEVERIAEGQRFVTRLLAERAAEKAPALPAPPRVVTPH